MGEAQSKPSTTSTTQDIQQTSSQQPTQITYTTSTPHNQPDVTPDVTNEQRSIDQTQILTLKQQLADLQKQYEQYEKQYQKQYEQLDSQSKAQQKMLAENQMLQHELQSNISTCQNNLKQKTSNLDECEKFVVNLELILAVVVFLAIVVVIIIGIMKRSATKKLKELQSKIQQPDDTEAQQVEVQEQQEVSDDQ